MDKLLITGCHRSGTTLLASMIGSHKDIAIINEDYSNSFNKILSKKIIGVKSPIPNILYDKKRKLLAGVLIRKLLFFNKYIKRFYRIKGWYPYSIKDFVDDPSSKIILIERDFQTNVSRIIKRTGLSKKIAKNHVKHARKIALTLTDTCDSKKILFINLHDLTTEPEKVMKEIFNFLGVRYDKKCLDGYKYNPSYKLNSIIPKY